ncbi:MAG: hypothetical protein WAK55_30185, partial [Xanthobacteraceae bacterium]
VRGRRGLGALMPRRRMAVRLTRNEIQLLKELTAAGQHGRTIAALASSIEVAHLIGAQYIERHPRTITVRGQQALVEATAEQR